MAALIEFDKVPSEVEVFDQDEADRKACNVEAEILEKRKMLADRKTKCKIIKPFNRTVDKRDDIFMFKFICVCPQIERCYSCKHTGNVIIDRDVLTSTEHICFLATPKPKKNDATKPPRFYHKRILLPYSSARIAQLAEPKKSLVRGTIEDYEGVLSEDRVDRLRSKLERNFSDVVPTSIDTALLYIHEERRLKRVAHENAKKRCRKIKKLVIERQKRQIKKIVCVLFEELKDFLLNDHFIIDECSMLTRVILENMREFTDQDFYSTSNLREYQKILSNNLAVWINKLISALGVYNAQPAAEPMSTAPTVEPDTFLPVFDYISASEEPEEEQERPRDDFITAVEESVEEVPSQELKSIEVKDYDQDFL